jgi:drug/metabolite transporter (DMT)-like permease
VFVPLYAAGYRAAGRRAEPPLTPSAIAAVISAAAALLVAYRIINEPGNDVTTTIKLGAPLGLVCLAVIGVASAHAFQGEADWAEMRRAATATATDEPET